MRYCTTAKLAETFLLLPSPNSLVDEFVSNEHSAIIHVFGYMVIDTYGPFISRVVRNISHDPALKRPVCIYNNITKYNSRVFLTSCSHPIEYADEIPDRVVLYNIFPMCALFLQ